MNDVVPVRVPKGYRTGVWEVREPLASGAFATVYAGRRVEDGPAELPRRAALKFLPTGTRSISFSPGELSFCVQPQQDRQRRPGRATVEIGEGRARFAHA